jgi:septum formation protein
MRQLILASSSEIRAELLSRAGVEFRVVPARIDEVSVRDSLVAEGAGPRDIADTLAEFKAQRIASRHPEHLVLGCDQVLELDGQILAKPASAEDARARLFRLSGRSHNLFSAAVLYDNGQPVWRHVAEARLTMREVSEPFLNWYLDRAGDSVTWSTGGYAIEDVGIRLFERIEGDYFGILGLPLVELLNALSRRKDIL